MPEVFHGKAVLVTGAARGLGKCIAAAFHGRGAVGGLHDENRRPEGDACRDIGGCVERRVDPLQQAEHADEIVFALHDDEPRYIARFPRRQLPPRQGEGRVHPARHAEDMLVKARRRLRIAHDQRGAAQNVSH